MIILAQFKILLYLCKRKLKRAKYPLFEVKNKLLL